MMSFNPKKVFSRILSYLKILGKEIESIDEDKFAILIKEKIDGGTHRILVQLYTSGWISTRALLVRNETLNRLGGSSCLVLRYLLQTSYRAAEFKFAMDEMGNIYITEDIHISALTFDAFDEEYHAIPAAIKEFKERIKPEIERLIATDFEIV